MSMKNDIEKKGSKKSPQTSQWKLFAQVMFGNLMLILALVGFILLAYFVHGFSYKDKKYFTPKTGQPQAITPYVGDAFYEGCYRRYFFCRPSGFSPSRNGWDTPCYCYKPNIATYALAPAFVMAEYQDSSNMEIYEHIRIQHWTLQVLYAYLVTGIVIYLFRRKMKK